MLSLLNKYRMTVIDSTPIQLMLRLLRLMQRCCVSYQRRLFSIYLLLPLSQVVSDRGKALFINIMCSIMLHFPITTKGSQKLIYQYISKNTIMALTKSKWNNILALRNFITTDPISISIYFIRIFYLESQE